MKFELPFITSVWSFTSADVVVSEIYQEAKDVGLIGAGESLIKLFPVLEEYQQEIMQMPK